MVRRFKPEDSEGVKDLVLSILTKEYPFDKNAYADSDIYSISETYSGGRNAFFVFEKNKKIVGTVGIKCDSDKTALLRRLFVAPEQRRKGIGSSLVEAAVGFCRDNGYKEIVFRATDRMNNAMKLIGKHGFILREKLEIGGFHIQVSRLKI
ncbi:MAG: GNAT family N-acetyltransferase [Candidatus Omnitrophota bacterium]